VNRVDGNNGGRRSRHEDPGPRTRASASMDAGRAQCFGGRSRRRRCSARARSACGDSKGARVAVGRAIASGAVAWEAGAGTLGTFGLRSLWCMGAQRGSSESSHHRGSPMACDGASPTLLGSGADEKPPLRGAERSSGRKLELKLARSRPEDDTQLQSCARASEPDAKNEATRAATRRARCMSGAESTAAPIDRKART